jgi:hypothetical protein
MENLKKHREEADAQSAKEDQEAKKSRSSKEMKLTGDKIEANDKSSEA